MEPRSLKYIAEACAGTLLQGLEERLVSRVCTDSRAVEAGDLFIALAGEKFDAHDYLAEVADRGAAAIVAEREKIPAGLKGCAIIAVNGTRQALGKLAARYRRDFDLPVFAVGGSNGKTTTKELIAGILREQGPALWSEASYNNDVGVPLTLLKLDRTHRAAVLEVGTNHPGELAPLVAMVQPSHGVITSIGREHLEFFGNLDGVAKEEGWLAELLPAGGKLFVNGDQPIMQEVTRRTKATVVRVGLSVEGEWRAQNVRVDENGVSFRVKAPREELSGEYRVNLLGRHQVINALLALGVGGELGLGREQLQRSLAGCTPPKMRLQAWSANGVRVLDDSYNANADSMRAALYTLRDLPCAGRRIAVLGDMGELGAHSEDSHAEVGRLAAETGVNQLMAVGKMAGVMAQAARTAGLSDVVEIGEVEAAGAMLKASVNSGDLVLVKASRSSRLERVAAALKENVKN